MKMPDLNKIKEKIKILISARSREIFSTVSPTAKDAWATCTSPSPTSISTGSGADLRTQCITSIIYGSTTTA